MKIGIGVTTYKRPEMLEKCLKMIQTHTGEHKLYVAEDTDADLRGVAKRKNECLANLQDCNYIFLFDDDCYPIKKGWDKLLIDTHLKSLNHHFVYNKEPFCKIKNLVFGNHPVLESYEASGGTMLFLTQDVLKKVGGFYTGYDRYGFEHIGYSVRIHRAGLTNDFFLSLKGLNEYIYSTDYEEDGFFISNSTIDLKTKNELTIKNREIFNKEDQSIYLPIIYQ
jgi:hypothetical protein